MNDSTNDNLEADIEESILNSKDGQSFPFKEELQHLPEVIKFIQRLQDCIYRQRDLILKLYTKLKEQKQSINPKAHICDKATQTFVEDFITSDKSWQPELRGADSLVDQVKEAAENVMQQTGFVYEATSGMYYDYNTGYYYNAELGLYYDGNKGVYYYYDEASETFQFHSQIDSLMQSEGVINETSEPSDKTILLECNSLCDTAKRKNSKDENSKDSKRNKISDKEDLEDGECTDSSEDTHEENKQSTLEDTGKLEVPQSEKISDINSDDESADAWPPCLRVIVQETGVKDLNVGSLFIVTCTGGTLGREGDHAVTIPDINISKHHAKFSFCEDDGHYKILDLGSRNGTYIDGERMSVALRESEPKILKHDSIIRVGSTNLLCHIHKGRETCDQCEPGCTQQKSKEIIVEESIESKEERHRSELRRLRKRFGLDKLTRKEAVVSLAPGYQDRAEGRRKIVGSSDHNEKTQVASIHEPIQNENKGFKMLTKMGWSKGESLGKDSSKGVTEPILVEQRAERAGLGSDETSLPLPDPKSKQKTTIWHKTKKRYQQLE